jgi:ERCC4-type nuclease
MNVELASIPYLTAWQRRKLSEEFSEVKTVGDFMALRDPGSELRRIYQVGKARATRINQSIEAFVDEFLS